MISRSISRSLPTLVAVVALGAALAGAPSLGFAQSQTPGAPTGNSAGQSSMSSGNANTAPAAAARHAETQPKTDAQVEARIRQLHQQLKITSAEESQWKDFAQVMRDNASEMRDAMQQNSNARNETAVKDLRNYEAVVDAHSDGLKKLVPAFETLYSGLSDSQKKTADNLFNRRIGSHATAQSHPAAPKQQPAG